MCNLQAFFIRAAIFVGLLLGLTEKIRGEAPSYVYQHLDREDGLASSIVLAIMQDRDGFMWFGSVNGLQRYDGRQFIHYRHQLQNENSLASDIVEALLQDKNGDIWIASPNQLSRFSPKQHTFTRIPVQLSAKNADRPRRWQLQECHGNIVLQAGNQQETYIFEASRKAFVPIATPQLPALTCRAAITPPTVPLPGYETYVYLKDRRGNTWAAAEQLWVNRAGSQNYEVIPQRNNFRYGLHYNQIYSITQNQEGTIWLGTDKGIYYFNPEKQHFFTVSTPGNHQESPTAVTGFLETSTGEIWVSSLNNGIQVYDQHFWLLRHYGDVPSGKPQPVWSLAEDARQRIWAGSSDGTLLLFKQNQTAPEQVKVPGLARQNIVKAARDTDGTIIWWGTQAGLLVQHNPVTSKFRVFKLQEQSPAQDIGGIQRILTGTGSSLWVATSRAGVLQLDKISGKIQRHYSTSNKPQGLLSNETGDIIWYNAHTLAISTNLGLHFLDINQNKISHLTTTDGLPANSILNIVKASDKHLFFTTQFSMGRWNNQSKTVTNYGPRDGILHESYAFNTGYKLRDGRILFGTLQGYYYFHLDSLNHTSPPPTVQITGLRIFDKNIPVDADALKKEGIGLAYNQNFFTIEFASLNYYEDDKISYEYKLEGVDPDWRMAGSNRYASYTNLEGGTYQFSVKARRADGTTTSGVTTFNISIANPFWKTGGFYLIIFLLVATCLYGLYKLRINRLLAMQQVRARIARDLHDDMGSTLSTINIFSDMANQQVLANPAATQGYLNKISRYSHQMMESIDDIVWSINPQNDSLQNLISRMREFATELLEAKNIEFTIQADATLNNLRLPLESRYDCFMIFKEALNNIAKYSNCRLVWINIEVVNTRLKVEITDDGQGFEPQKASGGNGLLNMQKRAQNMKGQVQIKSKIGMGTSILLSVPLPKALFKPATV